MNKRPKCSLGRRWCTHTANLIATWHDSFWRDIYFSSDLNLSYFQQLPYIATKNKFSVSSANSAKRQHPENKDNKEIISGRSAGDFICYQPTATRSHEQEKRQARILLKLNSAIYLSLDTPYERSISNSMCKH